MRSINSLIPQNRINDKYNVIQTYTLLQTVIEDVIIQYVIIQLLNDETIPKNWFKLQNINSEEFRSDFKTMILRHIRPFLKSLFPFDKYDPNSILRQETPLAFIIEHNCENNLSDIMDNIYERLISKHNMNK